VKSRTLRTLAVFVLATATYTLSIPGLGDVQQQRRAEQTGYFIEIPSDLARACSFEFKGITADFLMLQAMTFVGVKIFKHEDLSPEEWQNLNRRLEEVTTIDPRFWDPYLLAETMMAWQGGMIEETNQLLLKAAEHRPWDYQPYYFIGFNNFYFLKDSHKAAPYLRKAAQIPSAPFYLQGLAARLSLYGNETRIAILFLQDRLRETNDPRIRQYLEKRFQALKKIYELEKIVVEYKRVHGALPSSLEELVKQGLLQEIPRDPYGGNFFLMPNGRIYSTSKLVAPW